MNTDMSQLVEALTAIADASEQRARHDVAAPAPETPDTAAQRRLGRRDGAVPAGGGPGLGVPR